MNPHPAGDLVIDVPEQLSRARRAEDAGLTALAAVLWLVALRPVLLLALWYLGFEVAYTHMVRLEGWDNRGWFGLLAALFFGHAALLFAWRTYNARRFGQAERRTAQRGPSDAELRARLGVSPEQLERLRASRSARIERPRRTEVVVTCAEGARFTLLHDPLGPRPARVRMLHVASPGREGGAAGGTP
jgi:poly-beta-1,6-N-acetyl-D-glucosamine biosynthesis protein PgaD